MKYIFVVILLMFSNVSKARNNTETQHSLVTMHFETEMCLLEIMADTDEGFCKNLSITEPVIVEHSKNAYRDFENGVTSEDEFAYIAVLIYCIRKNMHRINTRSYYGA